MEEYDFCSHCATFRIVFGLPCGDRSGGAVWWPLRHHGIRLMYMIDDVGIAESTAQRSAYVMRTVSLVFAALGVTTSFDKCQLQPLHTFEMPVLIVNSENLLTFVPPQKAQFVIRKLHAALQATSTTVRQLQSLARMLLALRPAVDMAPLYVR